MPLVNVSRVVNSPRLSKDFIVYRKSGDWINGRFEETETPLPFRGPITPGGTKDIMQVPEGDRTSQLMVFHSVKEMFITHNEVDAKGTSDEIEWRGNRYRIFKVLPWTDFGYFKAIGVSMEGD